MPQHPKISVRLPPALHALLLARVGHSGRVSDVIREALETYLGCAHPTDRPTASDLSDRGEAGAPSRSAPAPESMVFASMAGLPVRVLAPRDPHPPPAKVTIVAVIRSRAGAATRRGTTARRKRGTRIPPHT
jgi:Arc/MetJ-type ribon-helix-helix transcriptional regulator